MTATSDTPLILGGHTFIGQLGNETMPDADTQIAIVEACLDRGIRMFDTTHRPERVGLGRALQALGRRDEATIIAWNFFADVGIGPDDKLDRPGPFEPGRIEAMLDELQTDRIDYLVVHELDSSVSTPEVEHAQETVAVEYQRRGHIAKLGVWEPGAGAIERYGRDNPYDFMMAPYNVKVAERNEAEFVVSKELGWETLAVSPFIRGWELDAFVAAAISLGGANEADIRARLADHMLRFALQHPAVDRVTTAMRRVEWVRANAESAARGPLTQDEARWLDSVSAAVTQE